MTRPVELEADMYPMNQDRVDFAQLVYLNSIDIIAGYMTKKGVGLDEAVATIERDVRMVLDQKMRPQ